MAIGPVQLHVVAKSHEPPCRHGILRPVIGKNPDELEH